MRSGGTVFALSATATTRHNAEACGSLEPDAERDRGPLHHIRDADTWPDTRALADRSLRVVSESSLLLPARARDSSATSTWPFWVRSASSFGLALDARAG